MDRIHEEEVLGKAYDWKLMKRLLKYAKPYWILLTVSILLLIAITGLELLNPYLVKIAIDEHISGYKKPVVEVPVEESTNHESIILGDNAYILEDSFVNSDNYPLKKLIQRTDGYYLIDADAPDSTAGQLLSEQEYRRFRARDIEGLDRIAVIFAVVIVMTFLLSYLQIYILNYTSQKIIFNIRNELFNHLQGLSVRYFDNNPIGRLVTRVTNDTETLNEMYTNVLVNLFKDFFMLTGIMIVMISLNLQLALVSFSLIPVILLISVVFRKYIREVYRLSRVQLAKINSSLNENISGMRTIQIFKKEKKFLDNFNKINRDYLNIQKKEITYFAIFRPSIEVIRSLGIALLVYYGAGNVISGSIQFGVLFVFINYLQRFYDPILDLTEKYNILQSAMASSERIFKILDTDMVIENPESPINIDNLKGEIEFRNVWFAYNDDDWVLKNISFKINQGESVAIVGATGAGKTSIINLLTRFYDIQKGEILVDGINIKELDKNVLRQKIGVVLQDVFIFTGNIKDNIKLNKDISDEKVIEIAKYVNAHKFISRLPEAYDEPVMERGSTLSSGERQLLAFARTLVYNPQILILDEATSNIDTETEILIQDALRKLIEGRTSIAIAHRLSTIQHSDKIIVLKLGEIKEMGSHQELLNNKGLYYNLYQLQYKESSR
ncbi:ABC transporter ATP-binding protein [Gudongella sp. DL1XJH-153]|uniref:ABC transporter ATP-binding protein n=1 Tax=Gudongella sp. DL1XJH-153 TaxID=3409804 RepID=UPI003BB7FB8C